MAFLTPPAGFPQGEAEVEKNFFREITEHPRFSQREISALGLQAIWLSFRAPGIIGHFIFQHFGHQPIGDDPNPKTEDPESFSVSSAVFLFVWGLASGVCILLRKIMGFRDFIG
jgi:hypothetical protein